MRVLMISYASMMQELYHGLPRELAKLPGVDLTLLTPHRWKEKWKKGWTVPEMLCTDGYKVVQGRIVFAGRLHFALYYTKLISLLREIKPDVIDIENEPFNLGSAQIIFLKSRFAPHSRITMHASQNLVKYYPPPFNYFENYSLKHVDAFFARSKDAEQVLKIKGYMGRVGVITHGVDPEAFNAGGGDIVRNVLGLKDQFVLGYIGALADHKGIDNLLYAIRGIDCKLLIIGDGILKDKLILMAKELGVTRQVIFHTSIAHKDIPRYLAAMDLFVLPSRASKKLKEQFGRVLIEAMAAGIPVIGSDCGEIPNVIASADQIFQENNWQELNERIRYFQTNPHARRTAAQNGKERVKNIYSWSVIARGIYEMYQYVLNEK